MATLTEHIEFIPERLNEEPVVFLSMTNSEIKWALIVFLGFWIPVGCLVGFILGYVLFGFCAGTGLVFASMWLTGKRLRVIKRGKPKQYHAMALKAFLQERGLIPRTLIRESKKWDIYRWKSTPLKR